MKKNWQLGFTLIELMMVLAIVAILAVVAGPFFVNTINNTRQKSALGLLRSDLNQARNEAITRNVRVLLCVSNSAGTGCDATASASGKWGNGWVVCFDADQDGTCDAATATTPNPIAVRPALSSTLTLSATDTTPAAVANVRFNANSSQGAGGIDVNFVMNGTWSGATARTVSVARTGNISASN